MEPRARKSTSPWMWLGCTCAVLVVIGMLAVVGVTWFTYRKSKEFADLVGDPVKREAKTREVLRYESLPAGWHPLGSISIQYVMDMAMLTEEPPGAGDTDGDLGPPGFIYMAARSWGNDEEDLRRYLRGETDRTEVLERSPMDLDQEEEIARGEIEVGGTPVLYRAGRGEITTQGERRAGIVTVMLFDCPAPDDDRMRLGVWISADATPETPETPEVPAAPADTRQDLAGTPADPRAIQTFLAHFELCPAADR